MDHDIAKWLFGLPPKAIYSELGLLTDEGL